MFIILLLLDILLVFNKNKFRFYMFFILCYPLF